MSERLLLDFWDRHICEPQQILTEASVSSSVKWAQEHGQGCCECLWRASATPGLLFPPTTGINVFGTALLFQISGKIWTFMPSSGTILAPPGLVRKFSSCPSLFKGLLLSSSGAKCQWLLLMKPNPSQLCVIWGFPSPTWAAVGYIPFYFLSDPRALCDSKTDLLGETK